MESAPMLQTAVVLFTLAALGGLLMAFIRFGGKRNPPAWLAMLHGLLAALSREGFALVDVRREPDLGLGDD